MTTIITLLALALFLFFMEIFVPGGLLAIIGGGLIIAASVFALEQYGWEVALLIFIGAGLASFTMFFVEVKMLAKTPWGRRIQLNDQVEGASLKEVDLNELIERKGKVVSALNPTGRIRVGDRLLDARSDSGWIDSGKEVVIVASDVFHVRVRESREASEAASNESKTV